MARGILRGAKHGVARGIKHGALTLGNNPMAGVTQDALSGKFFPANATQWATTFAAAGVTASCAHNWNCQEPSGGLADSIGTVTLATSGAGHLFSQAVAGFNRVGVGTTDGTVGQKWINSTTAPDPSATSTIYYGVISYPAVAPAAARDIFANGGTLDHRVSTTGRITIVNGGSTTGAGSIVNGVHPIMLKHDITNSLFVAYTDQEKLAGTYAAVASNPMFAVGGQTAAAANAVYLHLAIFTGPSGQLTDAQIKAVLQTLGWTIPWT